MAAHGNGEFSFVNVMTANNGLKIETQGKKGNEICHNDNTATVKVQTIDELHSLQKKKSAPTTPIKDTEGTFANYSEEERQKMQLKSIRYEFYMAHATHEIFYHFFFFKLCLKKCVKIYLFLI